MKWLLLLTLVATGCKEKLQDLRSLFGSGDATAPTPTPAPGTTSVPTSVPGSTPTTVPSAGSATGCGVALPPELARYGGVTEFRKITFGAKFDPTPRPDCVAVNVAKQVIGATTYTRIAFVALNMANPQATVEVAMAYFNTVGATLTASARSPTTMNAELRNFFFNIGQPNATAAPPAGAEYQVIEGGITQGSKVINKTQFKVEDFSDALITQNNKGQVVFTFDASQQLQSVNVSLEMAPMIPLLPGQTIQFTFSR